MNNHPVFETRVSRERVVEIAVDVERFTNAIRIPTRILTLFSSEAGLMKCEPRQSQYNVRPHPGPLPQGEGDRRTVVGNRLTALHIPPQQIQEQCQDAHRMPTHHSFNNIPGGEWLDWFPQSLRIGSYDRPQLRERFGERRRVTLVRRNRDARKLASLREKVRLRLNILTQGRPSGSRANPGLCSQTPWGFPRGQRQLNPPLKWWNISNVPVARNLPTRRDDCPVAFTRQGPSEIGMMRLRIAVMNEVAGSARTRTCCGWSFRHSRDPFLI